MSTQSRDARLSHQVPDDQVLGLGTGKQRCRVLKTTSDMGQAKYVQHIKTMTVNVLCHVMFRTGRIQYVILTLWSFSCTGTVSEYLMKFDKNIQKSQNKGLPHANQKGRMGSQSPPPKYEMPPRIWAFQRWKGKFRYLNERHQTSVLGIGT